MIPCASVVHKAWKEPSIFLFLSLALPFPTRAPGLVQDNMSGSEGEESWEQEPSLKHIKLEIPEELSSQTGLVPSSSVSLKDFNLLSKTMRTQMEPTYKFDTAFDLLDSSNAVLYAKGSIKSARDIGVLWEECPTPLSPTASPLHYGRRFT
jgi:hypothetical protein